MKINAYLEQNFPTVQLIPSIYHQWDKRIHFSLGEEIYQFTENDQLNLERFNIVYKQVHTIFKALFDKDDDLILVTNIYLEVGQQTQKIKVYAPNLKDQRQLKHLQVKTYPYPFETDEQELYEMQQFSLCCKVQDLKIEDLLKGAIHEDFPLKPKFRTNFVHYPDVFFVNQTKDIIFFIYDDRGCEVIARKPERLRMLYETHYEWVADYDRAEIEKGLAL